MLWCSDEKLSKEGNHHSLLFAHILLELERANFLLVLPYRY